MRIVFLADRYSVNTSSWTGLLAKMGHEVEVLSARDTIEGSDDGTWTSWGVLRKVRRYWEFVSRARTAVSRAKPDILVGYRVTSYGIAAALCGCRPLVVAAQGQNIVSLEHSVLFRPVLALAARYTLRRADMIHSWAPHMTRRLVQLGAPRERILTCPRGIDTQSFNRKEKEASNAQVTIVSSRSLRPYYRTDCILQAFGMAIKSCGKLNRYLVLGDGPCREKLSALSDTLGVADRVDFLGAVPYAQLADHLAAADVYVSAVPTDGVSASLLEAMSCGLFPVVVDNVANRVWVRDGVNGLLFSEGDCEALAKCIVRATEDSELRSSAMDYNTRLVAEKCDLHKNMQLFSKLYGRLVGGERPDFAELSPLRSQSEDGY